MSTASDPYYRPSSSLGWPVYQPRTAPAPERDRPAVILGPATCTRCGQLVDWAGIAWLDHGTAAWHQCRWQPHRARPVVATVTREPARLPRILAVLEVAVVVVIVAAAAALVANELLHLVEL